MLVFRAIARATGGSVDQRVDRKGIATTAAVMGGRGSKSRRHVWAYAHDQTRITAGCTVLEVGARPARTIANKRNKKAGAASAGGGDCACGWPWPGFMCTRAFGRVWAHVSLGPDSGCRSTGLFQPLSPSQTRRAACPHAVCIAPLTAPARWGHRGPTPDILIPRSITIIPIQSRKGLGLRINVLFASPPVHSQLYSSSCPTAHRHPSASHASDPAPRILFKHPPLHH